MKTSTQIGWCLLIVILTCVSSTTAQTQRLGFPSGTFKIPAKGATVRDGYCMDKGVPAPKAHSNLGEILLGADAVKLRIGNQELPMKDAVQKGLITLEAQELRLEDVLDRRQVPRYLDSTETLSQVLSRIDSLRRSNRIPERESRFVQAIEAFAKNNAGGGDGRRVAWMNKTNQEIEVIVTSPYVVSDFKGSSVVDNSVIRAVDETRGHREIQDEVWLRNAIRGAAESGNLDKYWGSANERHDILTYKHVGDTFHALVRSDMGIEYATLRKGHISRSPALGINAIDEFDQAIVATVKSHSTDDVRFLHVSPHTGEANGEASVHVGTDTIRVTVEELRALRDPKSPAVQFDSYFNRDTSPTVVVTRNEFVRGRDKGIFLDGFDREVIDPVALVEALQERYPQRTFLLDDPNALALTNARQIPTLRDANEIAVLSSDKQSFDSNNVIDFNIVENLVRDFQKANVTVIPEVTVEKLTEGIRQGVQVEETVRRANLIVLTGHKDKAFKDFVIGLNNAGVFDGKIVALFSCGENGDVVLNSGLIGSEKGPRAVLFFSDTINASAVEQVLRELAKNIGKGGLPPGTNLRNLLNLSVDAAAKNPRNASLQKEIMKLRKAVIQISHNDRQLEWNRTHAISTSVVLV